MVAVMAKERGRPKENEQGTRQVRVNDDIGEMIGWIIKIEGGSTAKLLDPLIRDSVVARYEAIKGIAESIKKAKDKRPKSAG